MMVMVMVMVMRMRREVSVTARFSADIVGMIVPSSGVPLGLVSQKNYELEDLESAVRDGQQNASSVGDASTSSGSQIHSGFDDIHAALNAQVNQPGCHAMAIRDYYPFWKHHNERSHAGKLLLHDPDDDSVLHMFFDDNIGYDDGHIVDVRDVSTGGPMPFPDVKNKNLIKVEALNAILDNKYFIRAIESAVHT